MPELDYEEIKKLYEVDKLSWEEIANKYDTYPNKIIRFAKSNGGVEKRSASESQKLSLEKGNRVHPTLGKKRSEETKSAISKAQAQNWEKLSNKEKKRRAEIAKENWKNKTPEEIFLMRQNAVQGVLKASKSGSKFENYVVDNLMNDGFSVETHKEDFINQENVHIDIYLPEMSLAIEIDGPAHFLPIWGQDKLDKHIAKDKKKNDLLIYKGLTVLRVKCLARNISKIKMENAYREIVEKIRAIEANPATFNNTTQEIEVN